MEQHTLPLMELTPFTSIHNLFVEDEQIYGTFFEQQQKYRLPEKVLRALKNNNIE